MSSPLSPAVATGAGVEVRRSLRRRRTATAFRERGRAVVVLPAGLSAAQETDLVAKVLGRLEAGERRRGADLDLHARARLLSTRHLAGRARPTSVRWVTNQSTRWGSCTPAEGTIRLSHQLQGMPGWVIDYVLLHELAHLLVPGHGPAFWALLADYPHTDRARGFLDGVAFGAGRELDGSPVPGGDAPWGEVAGAGAQGEGQGPSLPRPADLSR